MESTETSRDSVERVDRRSRSLDNVLVVVVAAVLVVIGVFLRWEDQVARHDQYPYLIGDPDSALHLHLLRHAESTGDLHVRRVVWDNAPHGRVNEWSSANLLFLRVASLFFGADRAGEAAFLTAVPPLLGGLMILLPSMLALALRRHRLAVFWAAASALLPGQVASQLSGMVDHHALQVASWTIALAAFALFTFDGRAWLGYIAGAAQATLFAVGPMEHLPVFTLTAALALWDCGMAYRPQQFPEFWRRWSVTGLALTLLFAAMARFPHERLEVFGVWHVLLWGLLTGMLALLHSPRFPSLSARAVFGGGTVSFALVIAAFVFVRWGEPLTIMQDPRFPAHARVVQELHRYPGTVSDITWRILIEGGLLWFAPLLLLARQRKQYRSDAGSRWAVALGVLLLVSLLWMLFMSRGIRIASPILAIVPALLLQRVRISSRWQMLVFAAAMALPAWNITVWSQGGGTYADANFQRMRAYHRAAEALADDLAIEPPPVILVPLDGAPYFFLEGSARTVGSFYWSNLDGLEDAVTLLTTNNPLEFERISIERELEYVLIPPMELRNAMFAAAATVRWENPRDRRIGTGNIVQQLVRREHELRLRTAVLTRDAPGWMLLRNPFFTRSQ